MRWLSSVCASCCSSCSVSAVMISVVSSAYVYTVDFVMVLMMLFMYRRKNVAESVLPCGVPSVIVCVSDCACWVCVDCRLFWKYVLNCSVSGVKLNSCLSLCINLSCDIVSYAFDRSTYIASVGLCLDVCLCMSFIIVCSAVVVLEFGLNAYCVGDSMLFCSRCFISWLFIIVSKILAIIGSSEIGL